MNHFEPKIVSFLCNWCSYAGADLAGISRFQYPPNIRVIRVMCSARVDPAFIFEAFLSSADAVLVLGCHLGDCHYLNGNYHAEKKMKRTKRLLDIAGVSPERLHLDWVSAAEGGRFAQIVTSFTEKMRAMGPLDRDGAPRQRLQAAKLTVQGERIRWLVGNELDLLEKGNVFGQQIPPHEFELLMDTSLKDEYTKNWIALSLEENPMSVREIAQAGGLTSEAISSYLVDLEEAGEVSLHGFEGRTPRYVKSR